MASDLQEVSDIELDQVSAADGELAAGGWAGGGGFTDPRLPAGDRQGGSGG